jgi:arginase
MKIILLSVPYHLGRAGTGVGGAPQALLSAGAADLLRADGHQVDVIEVRRRGPLLDELSAVVEVNATLAAEVRRARAAQTLAVVLGGDCNVALGVVAGLSGSPTGVVWFDAHGDFNTPESSPSGFLDGMPLAMACGLCHRHIWDALGGGPVAEAHVAHVGSRDLDPEEQRRLMSSRVSVVSSLTLGRQAPADALAPALAAIAGRRGSRPRRPGQKGGIGDVYLHIDMDVLDPTVAPAVDYPAPGGLEPDELIEAIRAVGERFRIPAVSLTAFDPERPDPDGRTLRQALELLRELVAVASGPASEPAR